jgi:hypothetical protein
MSVASRIGWFGLGFLVLAACDTTPAEPDTKQQQAFTASSASAATQERGAAGQPALTDEELDRLLDALEQELQIEGTNR